MQASKQTYSLLNLNVYFGSFLANFHCADFGIDKNTHQFAVAMYLVLNILS